MSKGSNTGSSVQTLMSFQCRYFRSRYFVFWIWGFFLRDIDSFCNQQTDEQVLQLSSAELLLHVREQPSPLPAGLLTGAGSACGTRPHPPGGSTSFCSSLHPAATSLCTSGAPLRWFAQGSSDARGSSSSAPLRRTAAMTRRLWGSGPLPPAPRKSSESLQALVHTWRAGWSRRLGGKAGRSPGTGAPEGGWEWKQSGRVSCFIKELLWHHKGQFFQNLLFQQNTFWEIKLQRGFQWTSPISLVGKRHILLLKHLQGWDPLNLRLVH